MIYRPRFDEVSATELAPVIDGKIGALRFMALEVEGQTVALVGKHDFLAMFEEWAKPVKEAKATQPVKAAPKPKPVKAIAAAKPAVSEDREADAEPKSAYRQARLVLEVLRLTPMSSGGLIAKLKQMKPGSVYAVCSELKKSGLIKPLPDPNGGLPVWHVTDKDGAK